MRTLSWFLLLPIWEILHYLLIDRTYSHKAFPEGGGGGGGGGD